MIRERTGNGTQAAFNPGLPKWLSGKIIHLAMQETQEMWVPSLGQKDLRRRNRLPTPVFLPGNFHGQRSLMGYSPWDHKELDKTAGMWPLTVMYTAS